MKLYMILEKIFLSILYFFYDFFVRIHEIKNIFSKAVIYKNTKLTEEQKRQIDEFYIENYGKKISYRWHRLYTSYTGRFDYKYFPEYIFSTKFGKIGNRRLEVLPFTNKNILNSLFEGASDYIKIPKTYLMREKGVFFDGNNNVLTEEQAINLINEHYSKFIIKISIGSSSGRGVQIFSIKDGKDEKSNLNVKEIFNKFGKNFVIQELVNQNEIVNKIYSHSINTMRVVTYITSKGYSVAPIIMRIGSGGNYVDNAHAGGMFVGVKNDGSLEKKAYTEYHKVFEEHPDTQILS